jgi:acetylornithine/N-succinyldiaminopimelate aminotransferase
MDEHVVKTYRRAEPIFVRGSGASLFTEDGTEYLDFLGGIAVSALGHGHPRLVAALQDQAAQVLHVSNLFRHPFTEDVAQRVTRLAEMEEVFFCNSGTEANEAALKIARKYHHQKGSGRTSFVALTGGFHGRTMGALAVTHKETFRAPFLPLAGDVQFVPPNDVAALTRAIESKPCALILEPIQGECGVHPLTDEYLRECRRLCTASDTILIHDEVQSGSGRTGLFLAAQHAGVTPDIVTLAKPIAAGLPMGMTLVGHRTRDILAPGDHGSTFAGGPMACRAALVFLTELEEGGLQDRVVSVAEHLSNALRGLSTVSEAVVEVRGRGLMQAIGLAPGIDAFALQTHLFDERLIVNATDASTLRLLPPFVVTESQIYRAVDRIRQGLESIHSKKTSPQGSNA